MINMAVVNIKDLMKYLVKISIILCVILTLTRYFSNLKKLTENSILNNKNLKYSVYLDSTIPGIKQANKENKEKEKKKDSNEGNKEEKTMEFLLNMQIAMIDSVKKDDVGLVPNTEVEEITEKKVEEKQEDKKQSENEKTEVAANVKTEVLASNVPIKYTNEYKGVQIRNETSHNLTENMLKPDIKLNLKNILIYHTHTCESYTPSENFNYKQTGNYRTIDKNYSVVRVGRELETILKSYGYNIIHDETYHDYPSYTGSYYNSLETVEKILQDNKNYDIVFDIHRDAIGDNTYAPTVKIGDEYAAQLMFVIGSDGGVDEHKNWEQNLKFAVKVQQKANELYPGLFKPIILRNSDYNQFVAKGASIIEVGATGNTLDQCLVSMKYLSKVLREL